jgi:hypothetical protein
MTWLDGDFRISQCAVCRHKARDTTCAAFPAGIPAAVLRNEVFHGYAIDGDQGIRLDPIEVSPPVFERITGLPWPTRQDLLDD